MKEILKQKWVVPVAALVLVLALGTVAFAATGAATTNPTSTDQSTTTDGTPSTAPEGATPDAAKPWGHQRSDETLLTGETLTKVRDAALANVGSDATVIRAETDADGNAAYEVHVQKADGTRATVYVDESFKVVSVEDQPTSGSRHRHGPSDSETGTTDIPTSHEGAAASDTI